MIATIGFVVAIGVAGWLAWAGWTFLRPRVAERIEALRNRIRTDPPDAVRTVLAANGPAQARDQARVQRANATLADADSDRVRMLDGFPDRREPDHRVVIVTMLLAALWIVLVLASARIDLPIVTAVYGGDSGTAGFAVLILIGLPVVMSLLLGEVVRQRSRLKQPALSMLIGGIAIVSIVVITVLVSLAPVRAEVEYRERILTSQQQIARFQEDGDQNAVRFARRSLQDLQAQQRRSADFNQGLVLLAAVGEAATGVAVPSAVAIVQLLVVLGRIRRARAGVTAADRGAARRRASLYRWMAILLRWAGVQQTALQQAVAAEQSPRGGEGGAAHPVVVAESRPAVSAPPVAPAPRPEPVVPRPADPILTPAAPPDDRFDLS